MRGPPVVVDCPHETHNSINERRAEGGRMTRLTKPVHRMSASALDGSFGPDRNKRVVITLVPGNGESTPDMLALRPERTRRAERIAVIDVYRYAMQCRVHQEINQKMREHKARRDERLASQRIARAEKRLVRPL